MKKSDEIKKSIQKNRQMLDKYSVKSIALFGSFARNEQTSDSDIDFLVEFKKSTFRNYMGLLFDLRKLFHRKVDLVCKSSLKSRIKPYILRDAQWL